MKTRIIAMLLLVVMLVSALASCSYSYIKEDYSKYVKVNKDEIDKLLKNVEIADGDFTTDEDVRTAKLWDTIYETLAGKADKNAKLTEGKVGAHDIVYYCYYATVENEGKTNVIFASKMQESSASSTKVQLGLSDNEGMNTLVEKFMLSFDFGDAENKNGYKTLTSGTAKKGDVAFITYTLETKDAEGKTKTTTYTNEMVVIGEENHIVAKKLENYSIATTFKDSANDNKTTITDGDNTYSNIKINWVVESGEKFNFTQTTYTDSKTEKAVDGTSIDLKNKAITYYVYPVYYISVAEYSAEELLKTVFTSLSTSTLPSFEGKDEAIKAFTDLKTALAEAKEATKDAEEALDKAQEAYDKAKAAVDKAEAAEGGSGATEAQKDTLKAAEKSLNDNKDAFKKAQDAEAEAEKKLDDGVSKFYESVRAEIIEKEYEEQVYKSLVNEYNNTIRNNLAEAIWAAMQKYSEVSTPSDKAIQPVYDRLIEGYRYTFSTGTANSTTKESYYKKYGGNFDQYLIKEIKKDSTNAEDAKAKIWEDAKKYVSTAYVVFAVADAYGQKLTEEDMKAYREDINSSYSYYEHTYGESNVEIAVQFDKFMDYLLEWNTEGKEEDETVEYVNGKLDFVRIGYSIGSEAAEDDADKDSGSSDSSDDHDHDHDH